MSPPGLLVIFANIPSDHIVNWNNVSGILQNRNIAYTHAWVYSSLDTTRPATKLIAVLALLPSKGSGSSISMLLHDLKPDMGANLNTRLYETIAEYPEDFHATNALPASHTLVMNAMTPHASADEVFNKWYGEEHIPLLSRVPSWLASKRYSLLESSDMAPRYLAVHHWGNKEAFETQEFKIATSTPWREEVLKQVMEKERFILDFNGDLSKFTAKV